MKPARTSFGNWFAGGMAALCVALLAGCATPSASQRVYDRYAELVATRNQPVAAAPKAAASASRTSTAAERTAPKTVASASAKSAPAAVPAKAPVAAPAKAPAAAPAKAPAPAPVAAVSAPVPAKPAPAAPEKPVAAPAPAPAPAKAEPAPVQVIVPVRPAAPAPEPLPEPSAAPAVPVEPAAVAVPAPAPASTSMVAALPDNAYSAEGGYMLKVGDGLQIYLRGIPMPEVIEDIIDETGKITLPLINEVQAAGLSASDLERNIRQTYLDQDIYRNITVNVVVPTRYYFILGEVRAAGRFQIMSATRVSQAIAAAGGYTEYASGKVQVKRRGQIVKVIKNARKLERSPEDDILLEPDDVVEVLRSWI